MNKKFLVFCLISIAIVQLGCVSHKQINSISGISKIPNFILIKPTNKVIDINLANDLQSIRNSLFVTGYTVTEIEPEQLNGLNIGNKDILIVPAATSNELNQSQCNKISEIVKNGCNLFFDGTSKLNESFKIKFKSEIITVTKIRDLQFKDNLLYWTVPADVKAIDTTGVNYSSLCLEDSLHQAIAIHGSFGKGKFFYYEPLFDPITVKGYSRFPYLAETFSKLFGIHPLAERQASEMFFDPGMRTDNIPVETLAKQWKQQNIKCIHAAGWYLNDDYDYKRLLAACHTNGILVSCWLETPMISKTFWEEHPNWREKTAYQKDANIDWRLLMNLADSNCRSAIFKELGELLLKNDWDGVNLAELYFEPSPVGPNLPENFTPMNAIVREEFKKLDGFDPILLFNPASTHYWKNNSSDWHAFANYRKDLCYRLKKYFLDYLSTIKNQKKDFELMLTVIDVSLTPELSDFIGENTENALSLYKQYNLTLQVEDPSNCWGATPERYNKMGKSYRKYVKGENQLLFDCNVVASHELGYGGFPSEKPSGEEIRQIAYNMSLSKSRAVFYAEDALFKQDFKNISFVLARDAKIIDNWDNSWKIVTPYSISIDISRKDINFTLDGNPWFAKNDNYVIIPEGSHKLSLDTIPSSYSGINILSLSGELINATFNKESVEFVYKENIASCYVTVDKNPIEILIDNVKSDVNIYPGVGTFSLKLPRGQHNIKLTIK